VEGPYRDLGAGFARLTGAEGPRRNLSRITCVEDALLELARNARDAGATRIYVASTLKDGRYRTLTVLDDGNGIPESHRDLILEPGVTTRHLNPVTEPGDTATHGAGLSLYQIKVRSLEIKVLSASSPTSIQTTFDTNTIPERALQSPSRPSKSNLRTTLQLFIQRTNANNHRPRLHAYYGSAASILATLLDHRIIQIQRDSAGLRAVALELGLGVSVRSVQRILRGEIRPVEGVSLEQRTRGTATRADGRVDGGPVLQFGDEERTRITDILRRMARAAYMEVEDVRLESRPGEISLRARVYEPEEEYE
jgi:hypothetical protein